MGEFNWQSGVQLSTMLKKDSLGFSLVEIALVLVLVGIVLRFGIGALSSLQTHSAVGETKQKQDKIGDALSTYLSNNQRLPCPDTNPVAGAVSTGLENRIIPPAPPPNPNAACSNSAGTLPPVNPAIGVVPYRALGLSRDDALDGWDNFFTYQVSLELGVRAENEDWSVNPSPPGVVPAGSITANVGSIQINAAGAIVLNNPAAGQGSIAVIISHGPNGLGAYTTKGTRNSPPPAGTDELDNTDLPPVNSIFHRRQFTDVPGPAGTFDDVVRDFSTADLLTPVIKDGALQSAMAQVREQLITIRDTAFGRVPVDPPGPPARCVPPANLAELDLPATVTVDPWGQPIFYLLADPGPLTTVAPAPDTHAFCVWSFGPNGANNSGVAAPPCPAIAVDDVGLPPVTYFQLRTAYPFGACP